MTKLMCAAALIAAAAGTASADVLWNQPIDTSPTGQSMVDGIVPGFNGFIAYTVNDVTVPAGGWIVSSVTTYFSDLSFNPTVETAVLNVFPKTGSLPLAANDPRGSPTGQGQIVVPVDVRYSQDFQGVMELTATGLSLNLAPGEYWVGLTPLLSGGPFGADLHWGTATRIGDAAATRDFTRGATPWDNFYPGQDSALRVDGVVPAPSALGLLGVGGLVAARRRRQN